MKVRGPAANFARNLLDQVRAGIQIFNFGEITMQRELITFGVIVGFLLSSVGHAEEKKLFPFTVGYSSVSGGRTPLWIAKDRGIFEKYGLDVKLVFIRAGATVTQALIGGDIQMTAATGSATIAAAARGAPVVIIAAVGPSPYKLVAHSSITSVQGLRGKTIGTSRRGSNPEFALLRLLPRLGLTPGKDVYLIPTGLTESDQRITLVVQGKIDATAAGAEAVLQAELRGQKVNILADFLDMGVYASGSDFSTTRQFLKSHPREIKAFLMAFIEATALGKRNKEIAQQTFRKYLMAENPKLLESMYNTYFVKTLPAKPYPQEEAIQADIEDLSAAIPELRGRKPAEFIDTTLLKEIESEGFFARLQK